MCTHTVTHAYFIFMEDTQGHLCPFVPKLLWCNLKFNLFFFLSFFFYLIVTNSHLTFPHNKSSHPQVLSCIDIILAVKGISAILSNSWKDMFKKYTELPALY